MGQTVTAASATASETFNRFVEGEDGSHGGPAAERKDFWESFGAAPKGPAADKRDFWDSFADAGQSQSNGNATTSIGTTAMRTKGGPGGGPAKKDEDWGEW